MADKELRIAMWCGPRNISTAMMRAWENRPDTSVVDEPFYAHYLKHTGLPHPGASDVIKLHESDPKKVIDSLIGPIPGGKRIFYQKQMTHHLLGHIDLDWLDQVTNCFLIRRPTDMITSLIHFIPEPTLADTGVPQQLKIFERICRKTGRVPMVVDSKDVLMDPAGMLAAMCKHIGVAFTDAMLRWPPGSRDTDGVWARHWYEAVEKSTGFAPYTPKDVPVPKFLLELVNQADQMYQLMYEQRLTL